MWGVLLASLSAYVRIVLVVKGVTSRTSRADPGRDLIASTPLVVVVALVWAVVRR